MPPGASASVFALEENPREVYLEVTSVLIRLANNVIKNPSDQKYRSIRLANPTVANKLLPAVGAMECLFEMGFKEAHDCLVLPGSSNLENIRAIHDQILVRRNIMVSKNVATSSPTVSNSSPAQIAAIQTTPAQPQLQSSSQPQPSSSSGSSNKAPSSTTTSTSGGNTINQNVHTPQPSQSSKDSLPKPGFLERIISASGIVVESSNKEHLKIAKSYIPLTELETAALEQLRKVQKIIKMEQAEKKEKISEEPSMQELLLLQLLSWFKEKFFTWVNNPPCHFCSGKTKFRRTDSRGNLRVEVYECALCFQETDFPRHTDPLKLLETRCGRCGEWGRCFTYLCLALGWDSRLVIDETDHVWTEVFLTSQSRWVHCDPCENAFDTPLMYELGWKKKLSYILAYSPDDVQDVTWRYSANHKELLKRRTYCTEAQLIEIIMDQRKLRQINLSAARKAYLLKRTLFELVELWKEPSEKDGNYQGRQSGSLAWRIGRGETTAAIRAEPFIWKPTQSEIDKKEMRIQYLSGLDQYRRGPHSTELPLSGWINGVNTVQNIFRKEERDWKMVYLARDEGCNKGTVTWCVDLAGSGLVADTVKIILCSKIFETGQVNVTLCGGDVCVKLPTSKDNPEATISTSDLCGASLIKLTVELSGGNGDAAWQHAQLFRTDLASDNVSLDFQIKMRHVLKVTDRK